MQGLLLDKVRTERYQLYKPIGKVSEFLDLFGSGDYLAVMLTGANGIGKTAAVANIVANLCYPQEDSEYFNQKLFQHFPYPNKKIRIVSNHNTLKETLIPTLKEWLPQGRYSVKQEGRNYDYHWVTDTGWEIFILTYDMPLGAFESANVGVVLFDEPPSKAIYKANVARLRRGGVIGILATMLKGSGWMYDHFVVNPKANVAYVQAGVEDACLEHGVRGFLDHNQIVKMISQYDPEDRLPRILGGFADRTGLVFKEFDPKVHVIKPFTINRRDYVVYQSLDPHPRNPDAVVWIAIDRMGNHFVIDELYGKFKTEELAYRIKQKDELYRVVKRIADPSAFNENQHTEWDLISDLKDKGIRDPEYVAGSKRREAATRRLHDLLRFEMKDGKMLVPPMMYFFDTCKRTIWEFGNWAYDEYSGKTAERKDPKEIGIDKDDHAIEASGRIAVEKPRFYEEVKEKYSNYNDGSDIDDPY